MARRPKKHDSSVESKTIAELAKEQGVKPITWDELVALWPGKDDDPDEFLEFIRTIRGRGRNSNAKNVGRGTDRHVRSKPPAQKKGRKGG